MPPAKVEARQSASGLDFKLHPLVVINISDHLLRIKANALDQAQGSDRVLGCLLGQQNGRVVDISNSFEIKYSMGPSGIDIDDAFLIKKQEQYKQVFATLDIVGWYATGKALTNAEMVIHRKISEHNESPVFLQLDPVFSAAQKDLPISLYESELHTVDNVPAFIFVQANFTIETSEAERIGVNQVAKVLPSGKASGVEQLSAHMTSVHAALKMLQGRIRLVSDHVDKMASGHVPFDHSLVRQISSTLQRFPAVETSQFQDDYLKDHNDALLTILLSSWINCTSAVNELVDKFNVAYDRSSRRK
ncbi:hypothetical protein WJX84_003105 [Apatococcus fuscideae]|uniref:COP9 signalosome complex subunit 6 n=1 Tax=Apatococcus fuscideae TaxID=2026836 RepID=A0AAW1SNV1_9CHLO